MFRIQSIWYFKNYKCKTVKVKLNILALFCIENRMKTPLGKTAETFTQFEGGLSFFTGVSLTILEDIRKLAQLLTIKQSSDMKRSEH